MITLACIRKNIARIIASNRYTRVLFKRIALDEKMLSLLLSDPLCALRVRRNQSLATKMADIASQKKRVMATETNKQKVQAAQKSIVAVQDPITDISTGINWGPRAFPLSRHAVYFRNGMQHLLERWLRRLSIDASVILIADAEVMEEAQKISRRIPQIKGLIALEIENGCEANEQEIRNWIAQFRDLDAIVVPLPVGHKAIEFIPNSTIPDIGPEYMLFRKLWRLGFRQYAHLSFGGLRQMEIPFLLDAFEGKHKGQRCFVAGNGPSLNKIDMKLLKDEITLGSNRCYFGFEQWGFPFKYWACIDRLQLEEYGLEYQDHLPEETVKFIPFEYMPLLQFPNCCPVNFDYEWRPPHRFSGRTDVLYLGFTVTHCLLQIAYIMGCNPIYLIGVDHRYNLNPKTMRDRNFGEKKAKIWVAEDSTKPTHFTDKYTSGEAPKLFITPKPDKAEASFEVAKKWTQGNGVEIINATPDSALEVFRKVDFDTIFQE